MRRILSYTVTLAAMLTLPACLFAQSKSKLSGTVADSSKPLSFVTVRIFKQNNPAPLQTTLSNDKGAFQFNKPAEGNYTLTFTHTGYAQKQLFINVKAE